MELQVKLKEYSTKKFMLLGYWFKQLKAGVLLIKYDMEGKRH